MTDRKRQREDAAERTDVFAVIDGGSTIGSAASGGASRGTPGSPASTTGTARSGTRPRVATVVPSVLARTCDTRGACTCFNGRWLAFTGRTLEQELGGGWTEDLHPDDLDPYLTTYADAFDRREPFEMEYRLRRADGEYRWVVEQNVPIRTSDGAFHGYMGTCVDVTELLDVDEGDAGEGDAGDGHAGDGHAGDGDAEHPAEIEAARARLTGILQRLPIGVVIAERTGPRIVFGNSSAERILGASFAEPVPLPLPEAEPRRPSDGEPYTPSRTPLMRALMRGEIVADERMRFRRPDGEWRDLSVSATPLRNSRGEVDRGMCVFDDITARVRAESEREALLAEISATATRALDAEAGMRESERRFRQLADAVPDIVWTCGPDGRVEYLNQRWYECTGLPTERSLGHRWLRTVHPHDRRRCQHAWRHASEDGSPFEVEIRHRQQDGRYRWYLLRGAGVTDMIRGEVRWFGTSTDIHDQKLNREALIDADRQKNEFLAMLGHELRNPLAPIRNAVEVLERSESGTEGRVRWAREVIARQTNHLTRLVDDLLNVARITRGTIELRHERIDIRTIVEQALENSARLLETGHLVLIVDLPPEPLEADGDPVRLLQVFGNLLSNAARYTEAGGEIRVVAELEAGEAVVTVRDSGIGIAPERIAHVFDLFRQFDVPSQRQREGLGIGLTLARRLIELHGGTIEAHSDGPGQGAAFVVRLPAVDRHPPSAVRPNGRTAGASDSTPAGTPAAPGNLARRAPRRVLVVDDNRDAAESLALLLQLSEHDVRTAHDGPEAMEVAGAFRPEVVLLDIGLPGMDGYAVARALRELPDPGRMHIVALTGYGQEEDHRRSSRAGFARHLVKPVDADTLDALMAEL